MKSTNFKYFCQNIKQTEITLINKQGNFKYVALEIITRISYDATTQQIVSLFDAKRQLLQNIRLILGLKLIPLACTVLSTLFVLPFGMFLKAPGIVYFSYGFIST